MASTIKSLVSYSSAQPVPPRFDREDDTGYTWSDTEDSGITLELRNQNDYKTKAEKLKKDLESGVGSVSPHKTISPEELRRRKEQNIVNAEQIRKHVEMFGSTMKNIDPWNYDIREEARERSKFHFNEWLEDYLTAFFFPLSIIYLYIRYGALGLQVRSYFPPPSAGADTEASLETAEEGKGEDSNTLFEDPEKPSYNADAKFFFTANFIFTILRWLWLGLFIGAGGVDMALGRSPEKNKAPLYAFSLTVLIYFFFLASISNKKAYRKASSFTRLLLHKERRLEELFFGWLPLPWQLVIFEMRLAADKVAKVDLQKMWFVFAACDEEKLRQKLGPRVLALFDEAGIQATAPNLSLDGDVKSGCKCNALALMLRIGIDKSFASPPFAPDGEGLWINSNGSNTWLLYLLLLMSMPYIISSMQSKSGVDDIGIASCAFSFLFSFMWGSTPPLGFTYSAIHTIKRRTDMLAFLNKLLWGIQEDSVDFDYESDNERKAEPEATEKDRLMGETKRQNEWNIQMDVANSTNLDNWRIARDTIMEFGSAYRLRTDANATIMIAYVILATLSIIVATVLSDGKISLKDWAFPITVHIMMIIPMATFAITLAMEGDKCTEVNDQSSQALSHAMIHMEAEIEASGGEMTRKQAQQIAGVRFSVQQLHYSLLNSKILHPVELLNLISLDRALVATILFAAFTQITLILENISYYCISVVVLFMNQFDNNR